MREFVCGYQTLLTCGGELIGFALFILAVLFIGGWYLKLTWEEWRLSRKKSRNAQVHQEAK